MHIATTILVALTGIVAVASQSLPELIQQLPACALLCFQAAVGLVSCQTEDFNCICDNPIKIGAKMEVCTNVSCDPGDNQESPFNAGNVTQNICFAYQASPSPSPSVVAAASSLLAAEIASVSATATSFPNAAVTPPPAAVGFLGAVALAALAL